MGLRPLVLLSVALVPACNGDPGQLQSGAAAYFEIAIPEDAEIRNNSFYPEVTISPDGRYVVYTNRGESPARLYSRDLRTGTTAPVSGVERGVTPFFSPDSRWIAFVSEGSLWKVPLEGGSPVALAAIENFFGGTWGPDGTIVYVPEPGGGLYKVSSEGGEPERLTDGGWYPSFLPDGRSVLFNSFDPVPETIAIVDLQTGEIKPLSTTGRAPTFVHSGHLLFGRGDDLWATVFDPVALETEGDARVVIPDLGNGLEPPRQFAVASDGTLVYIAGGKALPSEPVGVNLDGSATPLGMPPRYYHRPRVSPDGSNLAFSIRQPGGGAIWVAPIGGGEPRRLTDDGDRNLLDWMGNSEELLTWVGPDPGAIEALPIAEGGERRELFTGGSAGLDWVYADGMTPDGSKVVGRVPSDGQGNSDIALLTTDGSGAVELLERSTEAGTEHHTGMVSPDGRWLAFVTDKSGSREVYVRPLGRSGAEQQVSGAATGWAFHPHWAPDSQGLYYVQGGGMWSADRSADGEEHSFNAPRSVFELDDDIVWGSGNYTISNFDLMPDGESFLMLRSVGNRQAPRHIGALTSVGRRIEEVLAQGAPTSD